jgi:hypothetical protein
VHAENSAHRIPRSSVAILIEDLEELKLNSCANFASFKPFKTIRSHAFSDFSMPNPILFPECVINTAPAGHREVNILDFLLNFIFKMYVSVLITMILTGPTPPEFSFDWRCESAI